LWKGQWCRRERFGGRGKIFGETRGVFGKRKISRNQNKKKKKKGDMTHWDEKGGMLKISRGKIVRQKGRRIFPAQGLGGEREDVGYVSKSSRGERPRTVVCPSSRKKKVGKTEQQRGTPKEVSRIQLSRGCRLWKSLGPFSFSKKGSFKFQPKSLNLKRKGSPKKGMRHFNRTGGKY